MFHIFHKKWQHIKKGAIPVGIAMLFTITVGSQVFMLHNRDNRMPIKIRTAHAEHRLRVSLAATPEEHAIGLMWVKKLSKHGGKLFVFPEPQTVGFWMKNTKIPLDIIFIGKDYKIKYIANEARPCMDNLVCPRYVPPEPVQYVLEVAGGYAKKHLINIGDELLL